MEVPVAAKVHGLVTGTFVHGPPHVAVAPPVGWRVSVTLPPASTSRVHDVEPWPAASVQNGAPLRLTLPVPEPPMLTTSDTCCRRNCTPTLVAVRTVIVHVGPAVPAQAPLHPPKVLRGSGDAPSDSVDPMGISASQRPVAEPAVMLQASRPSPLLTTPAPVVLPPAVMVTRTAPGTNAAPTTPSPLRVMVQPGARALAAQAPVQPLNSEPAAGSAESDSARPMSTRSAQLCEPCPAASVQRCPSTTTVPAPAPPTVTVRVACRRANVAPTLRDWSSVTTQAPVPLHAPVQPVNVLLASAVAASVTALPKLDVVLQVPLVAFSRRVHAMPPPETVPSPVPETSTDSVSGRENRTIAPRVDSPTVSVHTGPIVPAQSFAQPTKTSGALGTAVSVTVLPSTKVPAQVPTAVAPTRLHAMPAGTLLTEPAPSPPAVIATRRSTPNVARTLRAWSVVTTQVAAAPAVAHASPQPTNAEPCSATAVSVTRASPAKLAAHVPSARPATRRQSMPAGVERMLPVPVPAATIVSACGRGTTVTSTARSRPPTLAVMRARPGATPVTMPDALPTVATAGAALVHVAARLATGWPAMSSAVASSAALAPTSTRSVPSAATGAPAGRSTRSSRSSNSVIGAGAGVVLPGCRTSGARRCSSTVRPSIRSVSVKPTAQLAAAPLAPPRCSGSPRHGPRSMATGTSCARASLSVIVCVPSGWSEPSVRSYTNATRSVATPACESTGSRAASARRAGASPDRLGATTSATAPQPATSSGAAASRGRSARRVRRRERATSDTESERKRGHIMSGRLERRPRGGRRGARPHARAPRRSVRSG